MKKAFLLFAGLSLVFFSCTKNNEDGDTSTDPTISINSALPIEAGPGSTVEIELAMAAEGTIVSITRDDGISAPVDFDFSEGATAVEITDTYTVAETAEIGDEITLAYEVTDAQSPSKSTTATVTIDVVPVRVISGTTGTTTWSKDIIYILDGFVFVDSGQTLTIQAGTIIKGKPGQKENASALIVTREGTIMAEGTKDEPIIFTAESDNIQPGERLGSNLPIDTRGLWGGVIILGEASLNTTTEQAVEGLPVSDRTKFGGNLDDDNSGIFKYVSIRHGGTDIGSGNEINGLTMGGVGSGTTIEYIEVIANQDDGFEWFGGTVNTKYLVSALCGDDAMDYDIGWRGKNQFWFVYQDAEGDRGGEHDGGTEPEGGMPYSHPIVYNATYYNNGDGQNRAITLRDNAAGEYHNSIFWNYNKGVDIEILNVAPHSFQRLEDGEIMFSYNIFHEVAQEVFSLATDAENPNAATDEDIANFQPTLDNHFSDNFNTSDIAPGLTGFVPNAEGAAAKAGATPDDEFFSDAPYRGAFATGATKWIDGWTLLNLSGEVQ